MHDHWIIPLGLSIVCTTTVSAKTATTLFCCTSGTSSVASDIFTPNLRQDIYFIILSNKLYYSICLLWSGENYIIFIKIQNIHIILWTLGHCHTWSHDSYATVSELWVQQYYDYFEQISDTFYYIVRNDIRFDRRNIIELILFKAIV